MSDDVDIEVAGTVTALSGAWTLPQAAELDRQVAAWRQADPAGRARYDAQALTALDTAGASLLLLLVDGPAGLARIHGLAPAHQRLLDAVAMAETQQQAPAKPQRPHALLEVLAHVGETIDGTYRNLRRLLGFIGLLLETLVWLLPQPRRWRGTALAVQLEQTALSAVPIVALLTFLVGCVIAFLGATVLRSFGATVFTVDLVGYSFLREFGVMLTAILIAGRSGSAFTAQLGSMKSREEVDAIRTLGLDPVEVLVMPRVVALLIALPLLTFIGMVAGLFGGGLVCALALDISPTMYLTRLHENIDVRHFWVGMSKAPIFAFVIAAVGCLEGFKVTGSAESVGTHTTSSVVQSIFLVILIDALAAIFFMEIDV